MPSLTPAALVTTCTMPLPPSTWHTFSRSDFGCLDTLVTFATMGSICDTQTEVGSTEHAETPSKWADTSSRCLQ